jgi:excisionase family DNA binding protein
MARIPDEDRPEIEPVSTNARASRLDSIEPVALPVPGAARALGIGTTKTRELIRSGELRSIRIDRRILVPRSEIDAYIARKLGEAG